MTKELKISPWGNGFADIVDEWNWDDITKRIEAVHRRDVERTLQKAALNGSQLDVEDFMTLVSVAAKDYIEDMAHLSRMYTQERFGKTISMYIPMYISNACSNKCVYCGFNHDNKMARTILSLDEIEEECKAIKELGPFENLLLVSGEFPALCGVDYFSDVIKLCRRYFHNISLEVQPLKEHEYKRLGNEGLNGVVCFQETYNRKNYKKYHPRGLKSIYDWRLNGYDRMGKAGIHKIGMGVLIGLEDWRTDVTMMARHLRYLQKHYWRTRYSVNFPRLCPSESGFQPNALMNDKELAQLTFAFRLFDHDLDISYSTRENPTFRDNMLSLGVTSMSAGSKTDPGGYSTHTDSLEQFEVSDGRCPDEVSKAVRGRNYDVVWKDWDEVFN